MTAPFVPMNKEAVAAVLDCTTRTIDNMVNSGEMPTPVRIAGRVFWHPDILYTWLDNTLRGAKTDGLGSVPAVAVLTPEINKLKVAGRPNSGGKVTDPTSRMRARQAVRMGLVE